MDKRRAQAPSLNKARVENSGLICLNLLGIICSYDIPVKEDVAEATGSGARILLQGVWKIRGIWFQ